RHHEVRVGAPVVLAQDAEALAVRALPGQAVRAVTAGHGWVDHDLVADGDVVDGAADRVDHTGAVAAGHVGQVGLRFAHRHPVVHVVERGCDDPHPHFVVAGCRRLDLSPSIRAG